MENKDGFWTINEISEQKMSGQRYPRPRRRKKQGPNQDESIQSWQTIKPKTQTVPWLLKKEILVILV